MRIGILSAPSTRTAYSATLEGGSACRQNNTGAHACAFIASRMPRLRSAPAWRRFYPFWVRIRNSARRTSPACCVANDVPPRRGSAMMPPVTPPCGGYPHSRRPPRHKIKRLPCMKRGSLSCPPNPALIFAARGRGLLRRSPSATKALDAFQMLPSGEVDLTRKHFSVRYGDAAGRGPSAWREPTAPRHSWVQPSDNRPAGPTSRGTAPASCCIACAGAA